MLMEVRRLNNVYMLKKIHDVTPRYGVRVKKQKLQKNQVFFIDTCVALRYVGRV